MVDRLYSVLKQIQSKRIFSGKVIKLIGHLWKLQKMTQKNLVGEFLKSQHDYSCLKGHGDLLTIFSSTASFPDFISPFRLPCSNQTELLAVPHAMPQLRVFGLPIPFVWKALPLNSQIANAFFVTPLNEVYP